MANHSLIEDAVLYEATRRQAKRRRLKRKISLLTMRINYMKVLCSNFEQKNRRIGQRRLRSWNNLSPATKEKFLVLLTKLTRELNDMEAEVKRLIDLRLALYERLYPDDVRMVSTAVGISESLVKYLKAKSIFTMKDLSDKSKHQLALLFVDASPVTYETIMAARDRYIARVEFVWVY